MEALRKVLFKEGSDEENNELKCVICNSCLCVPPILQNSVFGNVCGRWKCNSIAHTKGKNNHQTVYECAAKYLIFPCMYRDNGCEAELTWGKVLQHEETCEYKNFLCPLSINHFLSSNEDRCNWVGDSSEFVSHIEESHKNKIFLNNLELNFNRDYTQFLGEIYFTKISEDVVVVIFYINENKSALFCKVWAGISIFKNLQYQIKILDESGVSSTSLKKQDVILLCSDILKGKICSNWLKIDFNYMENFLDNPKLILISFEYNGVNLGCEETSKALSYKSHKTVCNKELREAKCDLCTKELFPPVFVCSVAHNICSVCRKNDFCPKCSSKFAKSRNIAYEKLKFLVDQPCKNHSVGCLYAAPYPKVKDHEEICHLNPRKCILGCSQKTYNLLHHLKLEHPLSIATLDVPYNLNQLKLHIFLFDSQIFLFTKKLVTDDGFFFTVQCLGMKEVRYKFQLRLINDKYLGSEIMLSHICHPELVDFKKHETEDIKGLSSIISIPFNVLDQMFPDLRHTKFKINIHKIETSGKS